jgi:hypothetical protein
MELGMSLAKLGMSLATCEIIGPQRKSHRSKIVSRS